MTDKLTVSVPVVADIIYWTTLFERRKKELIAEGMSHAEADNKASIEIRRQIRQQ